MACNESFIAEAVPAAVASLYAVLLLVGVPGNVWVLWIVGSVLKWGRREQVPRSVQCYILALCLSDLLILTNMSLLIVEMLVGEWIFGSFLCVSYLAVDSMNKFAAPFLLAALSRTCHASICRRDGDAPDGGVRAPLLIIGCSFALVLVLLTPIFVYSDIIEVFHAPPCGAPANATADTFFKCGIFMSSEQQLAFNACACALGYVLPTFCFCFFYGRVLCFVRRHTLNVASATAKFCRVGKVVLSLVFAYVFCWTPYWALLWVTTLLGDGHYSSDELTVVFLFVHLLPYISCTAYPVIYTVLNRSLQAEFSRVRSRRQRLTGNQLLLDYTTQQTRSQRKSTLTMAVAPAFAAVEPAAERSAPAARPLLPRDATAGGSANNWEHIL